MEVILVVGESVRTPSEHCRVALEQGSEPTNARIGPCDELATHPGMDLAFTHRGASKTVNTS